MKIQTEILKRVCIIISQITTTAGGMEVSGQHHMSLTRGQPDGLVEAWLRDLETQVDKDGNPVLYKVNNASNPLAKGVNSIDDKATRDKRKQNIEQMK